MPGTTGIPLIDLLLNVAQPATAGGTGIPIVDLALRGAQPSAAPAQPVAAVPITPQQTTLSTSAAAASPDTVSVPNNYPQGPPPSQQHVFGLPTNPVVETLKYLLAPGLFARSRALEDEERYKNENAQTLGRFMQAPLPEGMTLRLPVGNGGQAVLGEERLRGAYTGYNDRLFDQFYQEYLNEGLAQGMYGQDAADYALKKVGQLHPSLLPVGMRERFGLVSGTTEGAANARGLGHGEVGARAHAAARALGLEPGSVSYDQTVREFTNRLTKERAYSAAEGRAEAPVKPSAEERTQQVGVQDLADVVIDLGDQFSKAKQVIGPIAGRIAKMRDLVGTNPEAFAAFQAANSTLKNTIVYLRSGKQINEAEASRLLEELPSYERGGVKTWLARYGNAVRIIYRNLRSRERTARAANVVGSEVYTNLLRTFEQRFPEYLGRAGTNEMAQGRGGAPQMPEPRVMTPDEVKALPEGARNILSHPGATMTMPGPTTAPTLPAVPPGWKIEEVP